MLRVPPAMHVKKLLFIFMLCMATLPWRGLVDTGPIIIIGRENANPLHGRGGRISTAIIIKKLCDAAGVGRGETIFLRP